MEKKLRLRFLLITWGLLLLLFGALCLGVWAYYDTRSGSAEAALHHVIEVYDYDHPKDDSELFDPALGMAAVYLRADGVIADLRLGRLALTDDMAARIAETAAEGERDILCTADVDGIVFRYIYHAEKDGSALLAVAEGETDHVQQLGRYFIIFILLAAVLSLAVSVLLSRWATKPIADAWQKQNDFVSDASHELKTPLTVISTNTDAVLSNPDATVSSQAKWLGSIGGETRRMSGLVADLLFIAKADAGEIRLNIEPLSISEQMEGLCMEWESTFFEQGRRFEYAVTEHMMYHGDWEKIRRMTEILLDNALRYTPKGGSVRLVVNRTRKMQLQIMVSNNGPALTEEQQRKVFDRFYRVDASRTRESGGYGLGLCIAMAIARLHGGVVQVSSEGGINVFTSILGDVTADTTK